MLLRDWCTGRGPVHARGDGLSVHICDDLGLLTHFLDDTISLGPEDCERVQTWDFPWLPVRAFRELVDNVQDMGWADAQAYLTFVRRGGTVPSLDTWADMPVFVDPTDDELAQLWMEDRTGPLSENEWRDIRQYLDCKAIARNELDLVEALGPDGHTFVYLPDWRYLDD